MVMGHPSKEPADTCSRLFKAVSIPFELAHFNLAEIISNRYMKLRQVISFVW